ncbi:hypothetical protein X899_2441 [Burkholderia pseudomallei TSV 25]|uniref:hypothetical protein n=1 Tax=Burkholderia pseudomallei TaxID=28450 RepID=UPI00050EA2BE|nr:hypothetical protein [Burkholderia pseudomallei]AIV48065.1 hypothetical protein X988_2117 [Burkholderia pseudomallei TSV 48]KGC28128.1 hypothetical protein DO64_2822 [Burkholderia pseudomallei]KGW05592.1 hypothetical protein X899_2441 [Burkholderia pseudomallei TSV 25]KIX57460.1 hypothetical protein SZ29_15500 [Burkholderia pseudomallei]
MGVIYLDHNFVSDIAGHTRVADADAERGRAAETARAGEHRFAVSVWNMYETARAGRVETKDGCIEFITGVRPLYCANPRLVQVQEVVRYAAHRYNDHPYRIEEVSPFCDTPAQMWATFASPRNPATPFVGESFRDGVEMLTHSDLRRYLDAALDDGPAAAAAGRQAFVEGVVERDEQLIDQQWLMKLLPERNQADNAWIDQRRREALVNFLLAHIDDAYLHCPAFHAEEQTYRHRIASQRRLRRSDGIDVQFGVLAVAYCDVIVTSDGAFREMLIAVAARIGSQCRVLSRLAEI